MEEFDSIYGVIRVDMIYGWRNTWCLVLSWSLTPGMGNLLLLRCEYEIARLNQSEIKNVVRKL